MDSFWGLRLLVCASVLFTGLLFDQVSFNQSPAPRKMTTPSRYALYFTPAPESELARLGAALLGYDCYTGAEFAQPPLPGIAPEEMLSLTAEPRRYGFHGTLKAPFLLSADFSLEDLQEAVQKFAEEWPVFEVGAVSPSLLGHFIALTPDVPSMDLSLLAAECVAAFDHFRAPITDSDRQRRTASSLSPRQQALFERWGYPYVFDQFRFHMTLTGSLPTVRREAWMSALTGYIKEPLPLTIDALTLLEQPGPDARFRVICRYNLKVRK